MFKNRYTFGLSYAIGHFIAFTIISALFYFLGGAENFYPVGSQLLDFLAVFSIVALYGLALYHFLIEKLYPYLTENIKELRDLNKEIGLLDKEIDDLENK